MSTTAIIVAAGRGMRARDGDANSVAKQWCVVAGARVIDHTLRAFLDHPQIDGIVLVLHADAMDMAAKFDGMTVTVGGADRAASVFAGLTAAPTGTSRVLIHDVARPCVSAAVISQVIAALDEHDGAAPALAVTDALWTGADGLVSGTQDRTALYRAQTPQGFKLGAIKAAHDAHAGSAADDVEVARAFGIDVAIVAGDEDNIKITHAADFARAERILRAQKDQANGH
jgi:2-C-methyl-D-erythritol 4-phosphate cytidylyltransferase